MARLLLIDDNADMRDLHETFLVRRGYDVTAAGSAREALRLLQSGLRPNLILLDFHMEGMNGRDFREAQRSQGLAMDVPVVLYSADPAVRGEGLDVAALFTFPIDLAGLGVKIEELLARV